MGRNQKVTPEQVLNKIENNGRITKAQLSEDFEVCQQTIMNKIKTLRNDDERIFFDENGYYKLDSINNVEDTEKFKKYLNWVFSVLKGIALCGKPTKPLLNESKKILKTLMSKEERILLSKYTLQINKMIDYIEIEEEIEE